MAPSQYGFASRTTAYGGRRLAPYLDAAFAGWDVVHAADDEFPAPRATVKRFRTLIARKRDRGRDPIMTARPDRLEDLIALNALYRPGPMDLIPEFIPVAGPLDDAIVRELIDADRHRG